jgi:drug/metabolite transporter (DMT)-like permease
VASLFLFSANVLLVGAAAGLLLHAVVRGRQGKLVAALRDADPVGRRLWLLSGALTISAQTCLMAAGLYIPIAVAVVLSAALPIVVLPAGFLFLRRTETVGPGTAAGAVLVLAGVAGLVLG